MNSYFGDGFTNFKNIHFGNGDVNSPEKAKEVKSKYGVDGIMIGRAAIGNPWIFNEIKHFMKTGKHLKKPTIENRVAVCKRHIKHSINWKGETLGIIEMKRHYTNYFKGIPNFKPFRNKLVTANRLEDIEQTLDQVNVSFSNIIA